MGPHMENAGVSGVFFVGVGLALCMLRIWCEAGFAEARPCGV